LVCVTIPNIACMHAWKEEPTKGKSFNLYACALVKFNQIIAQIEIEIV
jgi:hypothetical protein